MKVTAIRVADFGRFSAPVAIEGLSGGLDILVGPNEAGKSTLLRALQLAFTMKHSATGKTPEAVRPYAGGAPTVEIDFECAGERWRLRKRWLAQRQAELRRLSGRDQLHRGEDAEVALAALLAPNGIALPFSLFWIGQGQFTVGTEQSLKNLQNLAVPTDTRHFVDAVIGAEIQAIAHGDRARLVAKRVRDALAELVSDKYDRPRNAYAAALKRRDTKTTELAAARARLAEVETSLDQLAAIRERERFLADPARVAGRREAIDKARAALESAREARSRADEAEHDRCAAQARADLAQRNRDDMTTALAQLASLDRAEAEADAAAEIAAFGLTALAERHAEAQQRTDAVARLVADIEAEKANAVAAQLRAAARDRAGALAAQLESVRAASQRVEEMTAALARHVVTPSTVEAARRDGRAMSEAEAQLSANAASVTVSYLPGVSEAIRIAGRPIAGGERLVAERPLVLDIAGIGTVTVTPARAEAAEALIARRDGLRAKLAATFAACGVDTFEALEAALATRNRLEADLGAARARLGGLAPDGCEALEIAFAKARAEAGPDEETPARMSADIEGDLRAMRDAAREAAEALATVSLEMSRLRELEAGRVAGTQARAVQRRQIEALLPAPDARPARLRELETALDEARSAAGEAVRVHAAWLERSPDAAGLARLGTELSAAEAKMAEAERELNGLREEAKWVEGALVNARNEDIANVVAELADELVEADAEVARFELEVAALKRLDTELGLEAAAAQAQYAAPVKARLVPFLEMLFPDATVSIDASYGVIDITRANTREPLDQLSKGTIEQIAVLSRLAFARLLAENRQPLPVILDDALVFSDDARLERMFRALEEAARHHQTIVLTCQAQRFAPLTGKRLQLTPWTSAQT